jgi:CheY-like chemotaxis protein
MAEALDTILRAGNRGRDMVKGLTNFARKDLRSAEPVDLNQVVREEASLLEHTLRQKIGLRVELASGLPRVLGEPGNIGSALMNLCVNAVDAMEGGGTLTLRTRSLDPDWVELQVEDTGDGMPADVLARALEPFYTTKPMGKGTGLGLAMVHGTVKSHGGTLELQSTPGQGTRIVMRLPALQPEAAAPGGASAGAPGRARSLRILLVDDDELIRATVPSLLKHLGHEAVSVASGPEALAALAEGLQVDVVLLDLNMPGMNGEITYRRLRPLHPGLPVLMASGFLEPETEALLKGDPKAAFLAKPYLMEELDQKLRLFLGH